MNYKEVEIKIPLDEVQYKSCKARLDANARLVKDNLQTDYYFSAAHRDFLRPEFPFEWLSIRERGTTGILNYKHWHPENALVSTHCDEYETEVSNVDALRRLLLALDFKPLVTVRKMRRTYRAEEVFEVALDTVDDLGWFIEIEYKGDGSIDEANIAIRKLAASLGIEAAKRDHRGYPYLMMQKAGLLISTL